MAKRKKGYRRVYDEGTGKTKLGKRKEVDVFRPITGVGKTLVKDITYKSEDSPRVKYTEREVTRRNKDGSVKSYKNIVRKNGKIVDEATTKKIKYDQGGFINVELSDEEVAKYKAEGYILEELHEGGEPGHTHENPAQWWRDVPGTPSKRTEEEIKLDKDLEESILDDNYEYFPYGSFEKPDLSPWLWAEHKKEYTAAMPQTIEDVQESVDYFKNWYSKRKELPQFSDVAQKRLELINNPTTSPMHVRVRPFKSMKDSEPTSSFYQPRNFSNLNPDNPIHYDGKVIGPPSYDWVSRAGAKDLYVHEMTHLLDDFVPQPGTSGAVHSILEGKNIPPLDPSGPLLKEKILNDIVPESYRKSKPKNMKEHQWNHATSSKTEIRAGLNQWRLRNNIDPLKNYSVKEIEDIIKNDKEKHGEVYKFLRHEPELLKKLNDAYVKNEETGNTLDDQYAKHGGSYGGPHDPPKVKQRKGVRENYDYKEWTPSGLQFPTSVSSHLMKAEYVDDKDESTGKPVR